MFFSPGDETLVNAVVVPLQVENLKSLLAGSHSRICLLQNEVNLMIMMMAMMTMMMMMAMMMVMMMITRNLKWFPILSPENACSVPFLRQTLEHKHS